MAQEQSQQQPEEEYIKIKYLQGVPYRWKVGNAVGRLYKEIRDNKRIVANRCPKCEELLFPPSLVCPRCHVRAGEELIEISDKGTVMSYNPIGMRFWNPWTGDWFEDPHPSASIKLDSGVYVRHSLEETEFEKLEIGMRVQAVWKEKRQGDGMSDIEYFRTIEEE
jgi:uncharacterized OB-fold protein